MSRPYDYPLLAHRYTSYWITNRIFVTHRWKPQSPARECPICSTPIGSERSYRHHRNTMKCRAMELNFVVKELKLRPVDQTNEALVTMLLVDHRDKFLEAGVPIFRIPEPENLKDMQKRTKSPWGVNAGIRSGYAIQPWLYDFLMSIRLMLDSREIVNTMLDELIASKKEQSSERQPAVVVTQTWKGTFNEYLLRRDDQAHAGNANEVRSPGNDPPVAGR